MKFAREGKARQGKGKRETEANYPDKFQLSKIPDYLECEYYTVHTLFSFRVTMGHCETLYSIALHCIRKWKCECWMALTQSQSQSKSFWLDLMWFSVSIANHNTNHFMQAIVRNCLRFLNGHGPQSQFYPLILNTHTFVLAHSHASHSWFQRKIALISSVCFPFIKFRVFLVIFFYGFSDINWPSNRLVEQRTYDRFVLVAKFF